MARLAITSFAFMLVEVPEPVWKMSRTNWSSSFPSTTSPAACSMPPASLRSSRPSSALVRAAARLIIPSAAMRRLGKRMPLIGKFCRARWVWAP